MFSEKSRVRELLIRIPLLRSAGLTALRSGAVLSSIVKLKISGLVRGLPARSFRLDIETVCSFSLARRAAGVMLICLVGRCRLG